MRTPSQEAATDFLVTEERHLAELQRLARCEARAIMAGEEEPKPSREASRRRRRRREECGGEAVLRHPPA
eukprot:12766517-Alexandrium_andersonii.AAC.1